MNASELASRLGARRVGRDKWIARCPAHKDRHPSLSIAVGRKVPVVLKCMSQGCETKAILAALDLTWKDVFDEAPIDRKTLRALERQKAMRDAAARADRVLVRDACRGASLWYATAQRLGARMAAFPDENGLPAQFHRALAKARLFEAIADRFDDDHCRGVGVPTGNGNALFQNHL